MYQQTDMPGRASLCWLIEYTPFCHQRFLIQRETSCRTWRKLCSSSLNSNQDRSSSGTGNGCGGSGGGVLQTGRAVRTYTRDQVNWRHLAGHCTTPPMYTALGASQHQLSTESVFSSLTSSWTDTSLDIVLTSLTTCGCWTEARCLRR